MSNQVAVMALINIKPQAKYSGIARLMFNRFSLYRPQGLILQKHMGSGKNGGFLISPSGTHQGLFCLFEGLEQANRFMVESPLLDWYRSHASELFTVKLRAYSGQSSCMRWDFRWLQPRERLQPLRQLIFR
jgi:hypothetical protein